MSFPSNTPFLDLPSPKHAHQQTPAPDALERSRKGETGRPAHLCYRLAQGTHVLRPSGTDSASVYVTVWLRQGVRFLD
jgi:hypothetical protein